MLANTLHVMHDLVFDIIVSIPWKVVGIPLSLFFVVALMHGCSVLF